MKFWKSSILILFLAGFFCGCATGDAVISDKDRLTPEETDAVIAHVRNFVVRSRKLRLTPAEMEIVRKVKPQVGVRYTGPKKGRLSIHWSLPNYRTLLVQRSGDLLSSSKADWTTRVITGTSSDKVPDNFFGAHGEDVSLPSN
ncbi:MAG: hypothetical protein IJS14_12320 [Lentisphaeria bacterium]|nr:hypothetical protein [Lentisphaeria bacterium]